MCPRPTLALRDRFIKHLLRRIQEARAQGIDAAASAYPYTRASNGLTSSFPPWVSEGGIDQMIARFKDPVLRELIKKEMDPPSSTWQNEWLGSGGDGSGIMLAWLIHQG